MPAPNVISPDKLGRLIGTARAPVILDVRSDADRAADPRLLPGAIRADDRALADLPPQRDRAVLERLRRKADRNAACALAAGRGVRAALNRLTEIRQAAAGLVTYDENGKRTGHGAVSGLHRRF